MPKKRPYDTHTPWDDPSEPKPERRDTKRFRTQLKVNIAVDTGEKHKRLVGPGLVKNLSIDGAYVVTKHQLVVGQHVTLAVPTSICPSEMGMPRAFVGPAVVTRVEPPEDRKSHVGLELSETFSSNMDFAILVDYIQTHTSVSAPG